MRKAALALFLLSCTSLACAQKKFPAVEVFGGYSFLHLNYAGTTANYNGWNAAFTGNLRNWVGFTADISDGYGDSVGFSDHRLFFLFGPQFSYRTGRLSVFGRYMVGAAYKGPGLKPFSMAGGGGVDAKITPHVSWRLIQADLIATRFQEPPCPNICPSPSAWQNNMRVSTGIVFTFAEKQR